MRWKVVCNAYSKRVTRIDLTRKNRCMCRYNEIDVADNYVIMLYQTHNIENLLYSTRLNLMSLSELVFIPLSLKIR